MLLVWLGLSGPLSAEVYYSKEEAFELAFGKEAEIENLSLFPTEEQVVAVEKLAQVKLDGQFFTFYEGKRKGQTLGYAAIESHTVRTQPETLLIVLSPKGELVKSEILAFHEPPEYKPAAGWLERLYRRPVSDLRLNQGVDAISGATLSSRASLDGIRKTLAIYQVMIGAGAH